MEERTPAPEPSGDTPSSLNTAVGKKRTGFVELADMPSNRN